VSLLTNQSLSDQSAARKQMVKEAKQGFADLATSLRMLGYHDTATVVDFAQNRFARDELERQKNEANPIPQAPDSSDGVCVP
jgi:hypothetical protein